MKPEQLLTYSKAPIRELGSFLIKHKLRFQIFQYPNPPGSDILQITFGGNNYNMYIYTTELFVEISLNKQRVWSFFASDDNFVEQVTNYLRSKEKF